MPRIRSRSYVKQDVKYGEYWVCDGMSIYQFEARTKVLTETEAASGHAGPGDCRRAAALPCSAPKRTRCETDIGSAKSPRKDNPEGEYFLEATPKRQEDAANFDRLLVQVEAAIRGSFFRGRCAPTTSRAMCSTSSRITSPNNPLHRVQGFLDSFVRPTTPPGWTKVVEDWGRQPTDERQAAKPQPPARAGRRAESSLILRNFLVSTANNSIP